MSKIRVHELAKELNKSSKDIIYALKGHGVDVDSHMSTISTESADKIRKFFAQPKASAPASQRPTPSAQAAEQPTQNSQSAQKTHMSQNRDGQPRPYNNQNRDGQRNHTNRDGQQRRPYNNQSRDGQRSYNNQSRDGQQRPYNNQNRDGQQRSYNNQNRDGQRSYNNQNRDGQQRSYNNQNRDGQRSYNNQNRDGQQRSYNNQNRDGQQRSYNNQNRDGQQRSFNNQNRDGGRSFGNRDRDNKFNLNSAISKEVVATKDTSRENRRNFKDKDNRKDKANMNSNGRKGFNKNNPLQKKTPLQPPTPKPAPVVEKVTSIVLPETITLKELGEKMKIPAAQIVKKLFLEGKMVSLNSEISYDEAEEIAIEYDILCEKEEVIDVIEELLKEEEEDEKDLVTRPPVVCVMGHVDHGKTSLLDAIRETRVTAGEAGGITQHIGAYVVDVHGQKITFLDTPGHEAFTAMRMRGAQSTDIAILVVAADDGVMPQTIEAINHAKAANIEIIVAVNKIDKPSANIDRVKQELTEYDLVAEDWGGQTIVVPVSAHTKEGLDDLLDMILLAAEMRELKANPNRNARGIVIEAELDKGRGPVATILVQKGTLKVGDTVAVGTAYGKVRAMIDDKGRRVKKAGPSMPVEILGLNEVPQAGEIFIATDSEKEARAMAETFIANNREKMLQDTKAKLSLDGLFDQIQAGQIKELPIVIKADVQGSVEAVKQSLLKLSNDEVVVKVIHGGVGAINESDVSLASRIQCNHHRI